MNNMNQKEGTPLRAVGYVRVSSQEQAKEGVSLDAQREKIRQWASLHDAKVLNIFEDAGISGTRKDRPGFQQAIETACRNKAALVVYSLSRFSRSTKDTLHFTSQLMKAGAELVSISEQIDTISAAGKMVFRILAVLNEFESDLGGERTKAALDHRKAQGFKTGGFIPYGFRVDEEKRLIRDPKEQGVIRKIKQLRGAGERYAAIARYLNERGIPTKNGREWAIQTVKNVLNSQL